MGQSLGKHRLYLHRPGSQFITLFAFKGAVDADLMKAKIKEAMNAHPFLKQKIRVDEKQEAYYEPIDKAVVDVEIDRYEPANDEDEESLLDIALEEAKEAVAWPMDVFRGQFMKHKLYTDGESLVWLISSHYLGGDGQSILYLARDVFRLMDQPGIRMEKVPHEELDTSDLPDEKSLFFLSKMRVKSLNRQWEKKGKAFSPEDRNRMHKNYHEAYPILLNTLKLEGEVVENLYEVARLRNIHLASLVAAAYYKATQDTDKAHFQVSTRPENYEGVGIYQGGIQVDYPKGTSDLLEMADKISADMTEKLNTPNMVHQSASILMGLHPGLIDSGYYAAYDAYENPTAKVLQGMYGLTGQGTGFQINDMGRIYEDEEFSFAKLEEVYLFAPFISNFTRLIGLVTLDDKLFISQEAYMDQSFEKIVLERVEKSLREIAGF